MGSKIVDAAGNFRALSGVSLNMTLHKDTSGTLGGVTADYNALHDAAAHVDDIGEQLSGGAATGVPAVLSAPVPQAAALTAALGRTREHQAAVLSGFAGFYRASAESIRSTAAYLRDGESASAHSFESLRHGGVA